MNSLRFYKLKSFLTVLTAAFVFGACSTSDSGDSAQMRLNATSKSNNSAQKAKSQADTLIITEAKFRISELEVESAQADSADFEGGPFILDLNISGGITELATTEIKAGIYEELEIEIEKPDSGETPSDPDFKIGEGENERFSLIIRGTYNGNEFTFRSSKDFEIEVEFEQGVEIQSNTEGLIDVTLSIDSAIWFVDANGNTLDPTLVENQAMIEAAIEASFEAFEDDDRDGEIDD
ncbi:hypothetical protein [Balneola vulgaris]|uniref:hypothetical protein n=1 Tax=Balneola vulgaris TaxID=287535 RepID=UPI0003761E92|nr:hypothetical protein [Balneola vulgaris]